MKTENPLSKVTVGLHWIIAISVVGMLATGIYMANFKVWGLYPLHKSIGVLLLGIVVIRLAWRLARGWPQALTAQPKIEQIISKLSHWYLLLASVAMPITGILLSGLGGHGVSVFGLTVIAKNYGDDGKAVAYNETLAQLGYTFHELIGYGLVVVVSLHVLGVLKHQFVYKDATLKRMLGLKSQS